MAKSILRIMRNQKDENIKYHLKEFTQKSSINRGFEQARLKKFWEEKMGNMINKYTSSLRLSKSKLYVKINSAPLRQEMTFNKEKILNMIHAELGKSTIEEIIIH